MQEISEEIFQFYLNKIDSSKLKRDYQKFPLKKIGRRREVPFKEDLEYLFLDLNFPVRILQKYLKCDEQLQLKWFKDLNVKRKSYKLRTISTAEFSKLLTGYEFPFQNPKILQKRKLNSIAKYGVDSPTKLKEVKEKNLATRKQHSLDDPNYSLKIKEKSKQTCLKHFGVENPSQSKKIKQKKIETCQKNFGVNFPMQSKIVLNKSKSSIEQKISENPNYRFDIQLKSTKTRIENGTINSSKMEDLIYEKLKEKFQDVKRQYKIDKRYPFKITQLETVEENGLARAFENCTNLRQIVFPKLSSITNSSLNSAFTNCTNLTSITFPKALQNTITAMSSYEANFGAPNATISFS